MQELSKINKRRFLINAFAAGYPAIHKVEYQAFRAATPQDKIHSFYGAEDVEYIKFLQQRQVPEFLKMIKEQLQGISL